MPNIISYKYWKSIVVFMFIISAIILIPFFINTDNDVFLDYLSKNRDGFNSTVLRSLFFAFSSTVITVFLSFIGAILLKRIKLFSLNGFLLSILLVPFLLGNSSIAFLFKIMFYEISLLNISHENFQIKHFSFLLLIHLWQFGSLFLYLFWLNLKNTPKSIEDYVLASRFDFISKMKNVFIPRSKNLIILLSIISLIFSFYENAKSQFIFKASQGTNTELISNWLYRTYQSKLLVNPDYAISDTFSISFLLILVISLTVFILVLLIRTSIKKISISNKKQSNIYKLLDFNSRLKDMVANSFLIIIIIVVFLPFVFLWINLYSNKTDSIINLNFTLLITLIASLLSAFLAIIFSISARIAWKKKLDSFNNYSIVFYLILFTLFLIPSLSILLSGFKWMSYFGYNSDISIYFIWIMGHSILVLPLLASFVLTTHFRVSNNELSYYQSTNISNQEIAKYSFLKRFKYEYLLTLIISFSYIWNEAIINKIFSDVIPSFASNLEMLFVGRGADYSLAFSYFSISTIIAFSGLGIWMMIIYQSKKHNY